MKMELRDAFAVAYLTGMDVGTTPESHAKCAQVAYQLADAALAARGEGREEQLLSAKERIHTALGLLNDVQAGLGDGPNARKIREALDELRSGVRELRGYLNSPEDVGRGG